jgi:hypothetical protein
LVAEVVEDLGRPPILCREFRAINGGGCAEKSSERCFCKDEEAKEEAEDEEEEDDE